MNKDLKSTPVGVLKDAMTELPPDLPSTNAVNPSTSGTSAITAKAPSPMDSRPTTNLQDAPNAARLIQALGAKLGKLVEWKKLTLRDGHQVYALCFPVRSWEVDPTTKELKPR